MALDRSTGGADIAEQYNNESIAAILPQAFQTRG